MEKKMSKSLVLETVKYTRIEIILIFLILGLALCINLFNNTFPLGYHPDEIKKVAFIKESTQDFRHPILMLQTVRVLNKFFHYSQNQNVVELGRMSTAFYGVLVVLFAFLIFRRVISKYYALLAALTVAIAPSIVIHAHYLKEDIVFTCFSLLSLLLFINFIQYRDIRHTLFFGAGLGLAISAQYKGFSLMFFYLLIPIFINVKERLSYYKRLTTSFCVAVVVFFFINYPILFNFNTFKNGFLLEKNHALQGHLLKISAQSQLFGFHLFNSLVPGMTWIVALLAVWGIICCIFRWRKIQWFEKVLLFYCLYLYFIHEIVPLKPSPDYMRYVIPIIPVMILFAYKGISVINDFLFRRRLHVLAFCLLLLVICIPFYDSVQLVNQINKDTRAKVADWIKSSNKTALYEEYASIKKDMFSLSEVSIPAVQKDGVDCLALSSFVYDRYLFGNKLKNQREEVYKVAQLYQDLFKLPYKEFVPAYKSFAFSNPTIRIIDISEMSKE